MNKTIALLILALTLFQSSKAGQTITTPKIICKDTHAEDLTDDIYNCGPGFTITATGLEYIECNTGECTLTTFTATGVLDSVTFVADIQGFQNGTLTIPGNFEELKCLGMQSCEFAMVTAVCGLANSCKTECDGYRSCYMGAYSFTNNVEEITCKGMDSMTTSQACAGSNFTIAGIKDGEFKQICDDIEACEAARFTVEVGAPPEGKVNKLYFDFTKSESGKDVVIEVNALAPATTATAELYLKCDFLDACDNLMVVPMEGSTVSCIATCVPGACDGLTGCTIVAAFKSGNSPKLVLSPQATIIVVVSSIISLLLVIMIGVFCYLKSKKMNAEVTFEQTNEQIADNEDNDTNNDIIKPETTDNPTTLSVEA